VIRLSTSISLLNSASGLYSDSFSVCGVALEPLRSGKLSMLVAALQPLALEASASLSLGLTLGYFHMSR